MSTKHIFVLGVIPFFILAVFSLWAVESKKKVIWFYSRIGLAWLSVLGVWEVYRLTTLGGSAYLQNLKDFWSHLQLSTSSTQTGYGVFVLHVKTFAIPFGTGKFWAIISLSVCGLIILYCLWKYSHHGIRPSLVAIVASPDSLPDDTIPEFDRQLMGLLLVGFTSVYLAWWIISDAPDWWRYLLSFFVVIIILFSISAVNSFISVFRESKTNRKSQRIVWMIFLLVGILLFARMVLQQTPRFKG